MEIMEISKDTYLVGVRDPNLRVFDIIMKTEYGTTYNSYLIKGEKNILIETAKVNYYDDYINNIKKLIPLEAIDYIIVNHTEPDHSGSIKGILEIAKNAQVICTKPAAMYIKEMINSEFNCKIVSDGEELTLGNKKFKFIHAPFLHWPDTLFTYFVDEKILFSCDAFGCHYCPDEGKIFDYESPDFMKAFRYYYDVIMGPFKIHALKAIDKIKDVDISMICPSHGPVLSEDPWKQINLYKDWSIEGTAKRDKKYIIIAYVSAYGYTRKIAQKLYEEIALNKDIDCELLDISENDYDDLKQKIETADALILGSPTFNQDALKPVWDVLSVVCPINVRGKLASAFGSYGWSGEAVPMIEQRLESLKFNVVKSDLKIRFMPSDDDMIKITNFAKEFLEKLVKKA